MMTLEPELSEVIQCQSAARKYDALLRSNLPSANHGVALASPTF